jgi:tryptophan-rich sensory protein
MRSRLIRHAIMVVCATVLVAMFALATVTSGPVSSAALLFAGAAILFGYTVTRLAGAMFAADQETRRKARRALIVAAAVPVFVLTPTTIASSPSEYASMILVASAVWLALALALTSFVVASARVAPALPAPIRQDRRLRTRRLAHHASHHLPHGA